MDEVRFEFVRGVLVIMGYLPDADAATLRTLADAIRECSPKNTVIVLAGGGV